MKSSTKALAAMAAVAVAAIGVGAAGYHVYAPDGVYEDAQAVVKIYDHRPCQLDLEGAADAHHATVHNKADGSERNACYVEDKASGMMLFVVEGGAVAMAHRSMFP
jgi:hypothetical protein